MDTTNVAEISEQESFIENDTGNNNVEEGNVNNNAQENERRTAFNIHCSCDCHPQFNAISASCFNLETILEIMNTILSFIKYILTCCCKKNENPEPRTNNVNIKNILN